MTRNQIEFAKLQEQIRTNLANEAIVSKRDTLSHQLGVANLTETSRHNVQQETETQRHNQAVEAVSLRELGIKSQVAVETSRHNLATEDITRDQLRETSRHNVSVENESKRHNISEEERKQREYLETARSNKAREKETKRHNMASEMDEDLKNHEISRHNYATETQANLNYLLEEAKLAETVRMDDARINRLDMQNAVDRGNIGFKLVDQMTTNAKSLISMLAPIVMGNLPSPIKNGMGLIK